MKTSQHGVEFVASFEGFVDHPYPDTGGVWTIGYGHTGPGTRGMGRITHAKGLALLAGDLRIAEAAVDRVGKAFTQGQYDSLVSIAFNCGGGILEPSRSLGKALRTTGMTGVTAAMALYTRDAHGKVLAGLVRRRTAEAELFGKPAQAGPGSWLTPVELRRCRELDQLRGSEHPTPEQQHRIGVLVRALKDQRKRIWRSAQDAPKGDGHGWEHRHRRQRYRSLLVRTA
jgi:lysozyme